MPNLMPLAPAESFDRYIIEDRLGEGSRGEVYRALDTRLRRKVALKVLRAEEGIEPEEWAKAVARMQREARAAAGLTHPNIVAVYDVGEHDGVPFIAMELVEGRTLRKIIGRDLPLGERLDILLQIAVALGAAHAQGVVHRDVKPENVMVREDGVAKVLDFGIARRIPGGMAATTQDSGLSRLSRLTGDGGFVGTPAYMAPEQLLGEDLDARADQFPFGVIAYELLTGKLPFRTDGGGLGLVNSILNDEPRPLEGVSPELESIVMRCLAKPRDQRHAAMEDIAEAIAPLLAVELPPPPPMRRKMLSSGVRFVVTTTPSDAPPVAPVPAPAQAHASRGTNPILLVGIAALAVGLFIGGILYLLQKGAEAPPPETTPASAPAKAP